MPDSARRSWYVWRPGDGPPNNWISSFGDQRPAWTRDERTGEWYLHSFLPEQPDLNWDEPAVAEAMHDVLRFWLRRGVDGFRIDVAHKIGKDPALGDNEPGRRHDEDWPSVHPRLAAIRRVLEEFDGDRVAVGEVYVLDQRALARYVVTGDELHLAHNFFFLNLPWSASGFRAAVDEFEELTRDGGWPAWCLNNHDHSRTATRYGLGARASRRDARAHPARHAVPLPGRGARADRRRTSRPSGSSTSTVATLSGRPMPWAAADAGRQRRRASPTASRGCRSTRTPSGWRWARRQATPLRRSSSTGRCSPCGAPSPPCARAPTARVDAAPDVFAFVREHDGRRLLVALNFAPFPRPLPAEAAGGRLLLSTQHEPDGAELRPDEGRVIALAGS